MAKQRSAKNRPAKAKRGQTTRARTGVDKTPANTLIDFTERGFDALSKRRLRSAGATKATRDKTGEAFAEAVERLKADYRRVLKRTK
jgi:hypothetical protein